MEKAVRAMRVCLYNMVVGQGGITSVGEGKERTNVVERNCRTKEERHSIEKNRKDILNSNYLLVVLTMMLVIPSTPLPLGALTRIVNKLYEVSKGACRSRSGKSPRVVIYAPRDCILH